MSAQEPIALDDLPAEPGSRIVRAAQAGAWQDGFELLAAASKAASQIEENAQSTYAAAYKKGYEEGRAAGTEEASRLVRDTTLAVDRYLAKLESDIAALAMGVVQRIFGDFDVADLVARAATQALTEFRQEKNLKVAVHPAAADHIRTALEPLTHRGLAVTVETNPALNEGACIIASDFAVIDASVDVQLRALYADLIRERDVAL
jgi:type III secretion protein L